MADARGFRSITTDMEDAQNDIGRLASAVEILGWYHKLAEDHCLTPHYGDAVMVVAEVIRDRASRLESLIEEVIALDGKDADD